MRYSTVVATLVVIGLSATAWGGVILGTTETFDASGTGAPAANWGIGGPDGWQQLYATMGNNTHREFFGSTGQIVTPAANNGGPSYQTTGESKGQVDPGSRSGNPGTLVMQAMCQWDNGGDTTQMTSSKQMNYITFATNPGTTYTVTAWVNTVQVLAGANWVSGTDVPKAVGTHATHWGNMQIGLKNGIPDATDLDTVYTMVVPSAERTWFQITTSLQATGTEMSLMLKLRSEDLAASGLRDLDVRWDDITITPEPTAGLLLIAGLLGMRRRRS